jgi:hypothetical protein
LGTSQHRSSNLIVLFTKKWKKGSTETKEVGGSTANLEKIARGFFPPGFLLREEEAGMEFLLPVLSRLRR